MGSAELLLHPVRMRIVQTLLQDRTMTTAALRSELPGIPVASLYRHVAALVEGGVLEVVGERKVRGTVERTYRLRAAAASVGPDEAATLSPEEHRQAFTTFVAGLLVDFDRYLAAGDVDLGRDLAGYRQVALHLSDEETMALLADLGRVLQARLDHAPAPGRRRRVLTTVLLPVPDGDAPEA